MDGRIGGEPPLGAERGSTPQASPSLMDPSPVRDEVAELDIPEVAYNCGKLVRELWRTSQLCGHLWWGIVVNVTQLSRYLRAAARSQEQPRPGKLLVKVQGAQEVHRG